MKLLLTSAGLIPEIAPYFLELLGKTPEEANPHGRESGIGPLVFEQR